MKLIAGFYNMSVPCAAFQHAKLLLKCILLMMISACAKVRQLTSDDCVVMKLFVLIYIDVWSTDTVG